jgi:DNA invertase Pin-like site-specific DNA recombinase
MSFDAGMRSAPNQGKRLQNKSGRSEANHRHVWSARLREDIATLWQRGLVPLAIAYKLEISVTTVSRVLREQGVEIPSYLTATGPRVKRPRCPHCGKRI